MIRKLDRDDVTIAVVLTLVTMSVAQVNWRHGVVFAAAIVAAALLLPPLDRLFPRRPNGVLGIVVGIAISVPMMFGLVAWQ